MEYSVELANSLEAIGIRELHSKNARPSTLGQHESGLTRLQRDQQKQEKGDARRPFSRSGKSRNGKGVLIRARKFECPTVNLLKRFRYEIEIDQEEGLLEIFIEEPDALGFFSYRGLEKLETITRDQEIDVLWVDYERGAYCWLLR